MPIDWFTVLAQAVNFFILVWLLKRFLYGPILQAVDKREQQIKTRIQESMAKETRAQQEENEFKEKIAAFDRESDAERARVTAEVAAQRQQMLVDARKELDSARVGWYRALRADQQQLGQQLSRRVQEEVFSIARKALTDLASADLDAQMATEFIRRMRALPDKTVAKLNAASETLSVLSAFELPIVQQKAIREAIQERLSLSAPVQFKTDSTLISGIALRTSGIEVAWSIDDYLTTMEKQVAEQIPTTHESASVRRSGSAPSSH
ncbi:F0F1 ATP synthase subunit B [Spirosoma sp. SC4-14]|uniref:F0F1 ATP synthase subunit B family protein n=1 Tax=Spirosoma sp. SC4-14 TaxID=3128900 RepID=UPI0030D0EBE5